MFSVQMVNCWNKTNIDTRRQRANDNLLQWSQIIFIVIKNNDYCLQPLMGKWWWNNNDNNDDDNGIHFKLMSSFTIYLPISLFVLFPLNNWIKTLCFFCVRVCVCQRLKMKIICQTIIWLQTNNNGNENRSQQIKTEMTIKSNNGWKTMPVLLSFINLLEEDINLDWIKSRIHFCSWPFCAKKRMFQSMDARMLQSAVLLEN